MKAPTRTTFLSLVAAPALLATGSFISLAFAGDKSFSLPGWGEARSATVRYADLDLGNAAGVARLERRIAYAIDQVCALPNAEQLAQRARVAACRAEARSHAEARAAQLLRKADTVAHRD